MILSTQTKLFKLVNKTDMKTNWYPDYLEVFLQYFILVYLDIIYAVLSRIVFKDGTSEWHMYLYACIVGVYQEMRTLQL